jgi:hypothetical protein
MLGGWIRRIAFFSLVAVEPVIERLKADSEDIGSAHLVTVGKIQRLLVSLARSRFAVEGHCRARRTSSGISALPPNRRRFLSSTVRNRGT